MNRWLNIVINFVQVENSGKRALRLWQDGGFAKVRTRHSAPSREWPDEQIWQEQATRRKAENSLKPTLVESLLKIKIAFVRAYIENLYQIGTCSCGSENIFVFNLLNFRNILFPTRLRTCSLSCKTDLIACEVTWRLECVKLIFSISSMSSTLVS